MSRWLDRLLPHESGPEGNCQNCQNPPNGGKTEVLSVLSVRPPGTFETKAASDLARVDAVEPDFRTKYARTREDDQDHAEPWTGQELDPQDLAHARLIGMGLDDPEAAKLAEWMTLRQEWSDEQIVCYECRHFRPARKRCSNHIKAQMPQDLGTDLATKPQRCPGFADLAERFPMGLLGG